MIGNLATSSGNTILKSRDGIKFSALPTNISGQLYDIESNLEFQNTVTFPKNTMLALGGISSDSTKIAYSNDEGVTWTPASNSSQVFTNTVNNSVWTGKIWVAVGSGGNTIGTSTNGNTWVGQGSYIFTTAGYGVGWAKEQALIIAGGSGTNSLAYSYDGIFWNGLGNTLLNTVYDIQWNGSIWIAGGVPISGNKSIAYSFDGTNWTLPTQTNLFDGYANKIGWNGNYWIVLGQSSVANGSYTYAISPDGVNWTMKKNAPNPPTGLTGTSSNSSSIVFSLTPPSDTVTGYNFIIVPSSGNTIYQTNANTGNSYTISGLTSNMVYTIKATSYNSYGISTLSSALTYGTLTNAPSNLTLNSVTSTSATVSFTSIGGVFTKYTITAVPTSGTTVTQDINYTLSSYTITGLASSKSYTISMIAVNTYGSSTASNSITASTYPATPTGLAYTGFTSTTISISWNSTSDTTIIYYTINAVDSNNNVITQTTNAPATTYTITGLQAVTTYTISISATSSIGTSNYSSTISAITADPYQITSNMYGAWSVRLVVISYTGPVFNVRRSSDNATQDFYADSTQSYLTTGSGGSGTSYASWIGGNTGYVTKWYDQSGKGNDASQTGNTSYQPAISLQNSKYVIQSFGYGSTPSAITQLVFKTGFIPNTVFVHSRIVFNNTYYMLIGANADWGVRGQGSATVMSYVGIGYDNPGGTNLCSVNNSINTYNSMSFTTNTWNTVCMSVQNPTTSYGNYLALFYDYSHASSRCFNGYVTEVICHNTTMIGSSMQSFYANKLF